MSRDLQAQLREEEARRARAGLPPDRRAALWARLDQPPAGRRRWWVAGLAAVAALIALSVSLRARAPHDLGGFVVRATTPEFSVTVAADGATDIAQGGATLDDQASGLQLDVSAGARVQRQAGGVRVWRGRVRVAALHRAAGQAPAVVFVSDGAIEVMGTHFEVVQEAAGGLVTLLDGHIRFRASDGRTVELEPGNSLRWPLPAATVEPAPPDEPAPPAPPAPASVPRAPAPADALLHEVELLRSRHDYEGAAKLLEGAPTRWPTATRERLSFELGMLYTHQLAQKARACRQWHQHTSRFPRGRYAAEVERAQRELACDSLP